MQNPRALASSSRQWARRRFATPYQTRTDPPLLVHAAHHRAGTVWMFNVYRAVAHRFGLSVVELAEPTALPSGADIALYQHAGHIRDVDIGRPVRGTHMVRDPRDVIVSSYFYHRWTHESWVHQPSPRFGGKTYQQHLLALNESDGLMAEMERYLGWEAGELSNWDYQQPAFLELRYEDLLANEQREFRRIFEFLGFSNRSVDRSIAVARKQGFQHVAQRRLGEAAAGQHLRSGQPGQWRQHFEERHITAFKQGTGDLLVRMGYEVNEAW